jgi:type I restriction enzyme, S subunit
MNTAIKFKAYPKYKSSGIDWLGDMPEEWQMKRLKYVSYSRVSNVDKKSEDEVKVKLCNYVDVYKNEFIDDRIDFMEATAKNNQIEIFELKQGDVLITKDSETPDDIGIPAFVKLMDTKNLVCGYHLAISTPIKSLLIGKYLFRLFQSKLFRSYFEVSCNGVTRFGLDTYALLNANILLPSFFEQQSISDFLDRETAKIDEMVAKKQRLMELLKEKRQALITHAVTKGLAPKAKMKPSGVDWLGDIPEGWGVKKLGHLLDYKKGIKIGPFGSQLTLDEMVDSGYKVYGQENVINNDFELGKRI